MELLRYGSLTKAGRVRVVHIEGINPFKQLREAVKALFGIRKRGLLWRIRIPGLRIVVVTRRRDV